MIIQTSLYRNLTRLLRPCMGQLALTALYAGFIYYLYDHHDLTFLASFSFLPVGLFATILAVFLAFRNNNAYARWWEARKLWGDLVNQSRFLDMQLNTYMGPRNLNEPKSVEWQIIYRHLAFVHQLRLQLRGQTDVKNPWLDDHDLKLLANEPNIAAGLLKSQGLQLQTIWQHSALNDYIYVSMVETFNRFYTILGGCERIRNTPFPTAIDGLVRLLLWVLIVILPVYLLGLFNGELSKALMIPLTVAIVALVEFANEAGKVLENPFDNTIHDVPLTALCHTIENDLLSSSGEHLRNNRNEDGILW